MAILRVKPCLTLVSEQTEDTSGCTPRVLPT